MLTFGELRKIIAPFAGRAGKCAKDEEVSVFARQVMENLLYSGSSAGIRKLSILATKGYVSLPAEVETPLKVRIDRQVATVWNKFFSFHSVMPEDFKDRCYPAGQILIEDGTMTPLAHELPDGGSVVGVLGNCDESDDSFVVVQGKDPTGREIFTTANGEQVVGERFKIKKGEVRYGQVTFGEITAVLKSKTSGYVSLFAINSHTKELVRFLADWSPAEEKPLYKKYRINSRSCGAIAHVSMLCRVRLKDNYHDNEVTLFDSSLAVLLAAQRLQSELNNDTTTAAYKLKAVEDILEKEAGYKKISGSPMDVFHALSGGAIRNIVS